jgi:hypothetical protein
MLNQRGWLITGASSGVGQSTARLLSQMFEAWTKPELLKRWWAPKSSGVFFISCEADVRAGAPTVSCSATLPQSSLWSSSVGTSK